LLIYRKIDKLENLGFSAEKENFFFEIKKKLKNKIRQIKIMNNFLNIFWKALDLGFLPITIKPQKISDFPRFSRKFFYRNSKKKIL
jgi:hypothetical protein